MYLKIEYSLSFNTCFTEKRQKILIKKTSSKSRGVIPKGFYIPEKEFHGYEEQSSKIET